MAWFDTSNQYHRTTIIIDTFDDRSEALVKHETVFVSPPCASGPGCRASSPDWEACEFDPKTGLCGGRMA